jgi:hypothetical protein
VKNVKQPDGSTAEKPLLVGLRDRALIALLIYSFARISAALQMNAGDYISAGQALVGTPARKGRQGARDAGASSARADDAYVAAAGIAADKNAPLFRTIGCERQDCGQRRGRNELTGDRMTRQDARRMIKRRARKAGLLTRIGTTLLRLQEEYRDWLDNLPPNLESSALADKLQTIVDLDLDELQAVELPRGYGRD